MVPSVAVDGTTNAAGAALIVVIDPSVNVAERKSSGSVDAPMVKALDATVALMVGNFGDAVKRGNFVTIC